MKRMFSLAMAFMMAALLCLPALSEGEKPQLRVLIGYQEINPNNDPAGRAVEEATGVHAVYETLPAENSISKLMGILSAKDSDVYDVISMDYATFASTVSIGAYLPLNDLLKEKGKELLDCTNDALWTNTTIDGQIMAIPFRLSNENYTSGLRVRTDLLKEAGVDKMPETIDEFTNALTKVKSSLGIVPITAFGAIIDEIAGAFGISNVWNVTEDGIHGRPTTPGAKDYVEYMHSLYTAGLLDDEWAQNSSASCTEKFLSGKALAYKVFWWNEPSATTTLLANFPEATFNYLPPLMNTDGHSGMPVDRGTQQVAVIPRVSSKADEAMEWMNAKVKSPEIFKMLCIGEENVHYKVIGKNEYEPINPKFTEERNNSNIYLTGTITDDYGIYWGQTRVRKNETLYKEFVCMQDNVANATIYYDPTTFMAPNNEFIELAPSVNNYVDENILNMIVGARDISEWDDFVNEYLEMGGEQLEDILNEWWNANRVEVEPFIKK